MWDMATEVLREAVVASGLPYEIDEGGGAFYGPKIDLKLRDAQGQEWQCSTIQFDFNLPERFVMQYVGEDGNRHTPFMIHRALFGSLERFLALLIEHYNGEFPLWLAPVQFGIVPVREVHVDYAQSLARELKRRGFRVSVNAEKANMRNKIKSFTLEKVPYILVVGDREVDERSCAVRSRAEGDLGSMDLASLCRHIQPQMENGEPKMLD